MSAVSARPHPRMRRTRLRDGIRTGGGLVIVGAMLFPVYWMINSSLQPSGNTLSAEPTPLRPTLDGYARALDDQLGSLGVSAIIALGAVAIVLAVGLPAAFWLSQAAARTRQVGQVALLVTQMIPGVVVANAIYPVYRDLGLLDTLVGLVLANAAGSLPFVLLVLTSFLRALPPSVIEAARIDGAGTLRILVRVVLPLSRNGVVTAALFAFLFAWSDFLFALTLSTSPEVRPITLGIYRYLGLDVANWNAVMATAVMSAAPAIVILVLAQRYIAAGVQQGAVK